MENYAQRSRRQIPSKILRRKSAQRGSAFTSATGGGIMLLGATLAFEFSTPIVMP